MIEREYVWKYLKNLFKSLENKICACGSTCGKLNFASINDRNKKNGKSNSDGKVKAYAEKVENNKNVEETILCLLYPITNCDLKLDSIIQFREKI